MNKIKNTPFFGKYFEILVIFCLSLVVFKWTSGGEIINGNDTTYPLRPVGFFQQRLYQWNHSIGGGVDFAHASAGLTWHGLQALPAFFGLPLHLSQKLFILILFNAISFSFYFFVSQLFPKDRLARLAGVVFYCFNPYLFNLWGNIQSANLTAYAFIPLASGLLLKSLFEPERFFFWLIVFGAASVFLSAFGMNPQVGAVVLIYFVLFVSYLFIDLVVRKKDIKTSRFVKNIILFFLIYLLFNLFWIVPEVKVFLNKSLSLGIPSSGNLRGWLDFVSKNTHFLNVIRMQGEWMWYNLHKGEEYIPFARVYRTNAFLIFWSFVSFAVCLWAIVKLKSRWIIFFGSILVLGLLASMGIKPPFGYLYLILTEKVKALSFIRSPWYKFTLLTSVSYSVFIAFFISHFKGKAKLVIVLIFILGQLTYSYPLLTGEVFPKKAVLPFKYEIPHYIFPADEYLREDLQEAKVVVLPRQGDLDYYKWGGNSSAQFLTLMANPKPVLTEPSWTVVGDTNINKIVSSFYDYLYNSWSRKALKILFPLNVKYLLQKKDYDYNFEGDLGSPEFIEEKISFLDNIEKVSPIGEWSYYQIEKEAIGQFIYAANEIDIVNAEPYLLADYFLIKDSENSISVSGDEIIRFNNLSKNFLFRNFSIGFLKEKIKDFSPQPPYVRFSPTSLFYRFIRSKEEDNLKIKENPLEKAKILTFYSGKRLAEIELVFNSNDERKLQTIKRIIDDYSRNISEIKKTLLNYDFKYERNEIEPIQTVAAYLNDYLSKLNNLKKEENFRPDLSTAIEETEKVDEISSGLLNKLSSSLNTKKYSIEVLENGKYHLFLLLKGGNSLDKCFSSANLNTNGTISNLMATNSEENIADLGEYFLKKGSNLVEVNLSCDMEANPSLIAINRVKKEKNNFLLPGVEFEKVNPAKYEVRVDEASNSFVLVLSENYHPWWEAKIKLSEEESISVSPEEHLKVNGYANGWIINQKGDFKIILEYKSQKSYDFLLKFTVFLELISLCYFVLVRKKGHV